MLHIFSKIFFVFQVPGGVITNTYGQIPIPVTVNVQNINDPPTFISPQTLVTVRETVPVSALIVTFEVRDPDVPLPGSTEALSVTLTGEHKLYNYNTNLGFDKSDSVY